MFLLNHTYFLLSMQKAKYCSEVRNSPRQKEGKNEMDQVRKYGRIREQYEIIQHETNHRYYVLLKNEEGDEIARSCS